MTTGTTQPENKSASPAAEAQKPAETSSQQTQPAGMVPITALHEEREKRQTLQAEVENLKAVVEQFSQQQYQQQPPAYYQQPQQVSPEQQLDELWARDPKQAVQAMIFNAVQQTDRVNTFVESQISVARTKYKDFSKYEQQIRSHVNSIPASGRGRQGIVDAAYFMVRGMEREGQPIENEQQRMQAAINAQSFAGGSYQTPQPQQLNDDEKKAADVLGISYADYLANKKVGK